MPASIDPIEWTQPAVLHYEPYYAVDTDGVHFQVEVDGVWIQAYVSRRVLHMVYGPSEPHAACLSCYLKHRAEIDAAVCRRVFTYGPESVLVRPREIGC